MPTSRQDQEFKKEMEGHIDTITMSASALDAAIDFISSNFDPDDIFSTKQLEEWAESNGYVKE
jgi:glycerol-3-phosphate responsive antiterminator